MLIEAILEHVSSRGPQKNAYNPFSPLSFSNACHLTVGLGSGRGLISKYELVFKT